MKKTLTFFTLFIFTQILKAQNIANERISLYFASGKYELTKYHRELIDKTFEQLTDKTVTSISLLGHTDNVGNEKTNNVLAEQRAKTVAEFIYTKNIVEQDSVKWSFERANKNINQNLTKHEQAKNRRVDIYVFYEKSTPKAKAEPAVPSSEIISKIPQVSDPFSLPVGVTREGSNVRVPQIKGTSFTMTETDFRRYSATMRFEPYIDLKSIQNADLTTMTSDGEPLMSAGMFKIDPTGIPGKTLDTPMIVRVPVPRSDEYSNAPETMKIWVQDEKGNWKNPNSITIRKEYDANGKIKMYYEFAVNSATFVNLDKIYQLDSRQQVANWEEQISKMKGRDLRAARKRLAALKGQWGVLNFRLRGDSFKILDVRLAYSDPTVIIKAQPSPTQKGQFTANVKIFDWRESPYYSYKKYRYPTVFATALNVKGDTVVMKYRSIHYLNADYRRGYGNEGGLSFAGIVPYREKSLYKNYILNERSFVLKTPKKPMPRRSPEKDKVGTGE